MPSAQAKKHLAQIPGSDSFFELLALNRDPVRFHERYDAHGQVFRTRFVYPVVFDRRRGEPLDHDHQSLHCMERGITRHRSGGSLTARSCFKMAPTTPARGHPTAGGRPLGAQAERHQDR